MIQTLILLLLLIGLIALGMKIPFAVGISTMIVILTTSSRMTVSSIAQVACSTLADSVGLIAIPLFTLAGNLLSHSHLSDYLIDAANAIVGRVRGGLAIVNVLASFLFGGISGSATADTASVGSVLIPSMVKAGYDKDFTVAVTVTSSTLGPIVPPSIIMIVYGWLTQTSVAALFAAGYIPGALFAGLMILVSLYFAIVRKYPLSEEMSWAQKGKVLLRSFPVLMMPLGIIVGIVGGVFSPTEAASFAVVFSFLLLVFYGELGRVDFNKILLSTASTTGVVCFLLALAAVFSRYITFTRVPYHFARFLMARVDSPTVFLFVAAAINIFLGTMMNPTAVMTMTIPILFPISTQFGIHPLHFGMVTTTSLAMGHITPPVGLCLFIGCSIAEMGIDEVLRGLLPFILIMVIGVAIIVLWPSLVLFIPRAFGFI